MSGPPRDDPPDHVGLIGASTPELKSWTDLSGVACTCRRCVCTETAEVVLGAPLCGCCAADCPDVHRGAWERRETWYANLRPVTAGEREASLALLRRSANTDGEHADLRALLDTPDDPQ